MQLSEYIADMTQRQKLADALGTAPEYLWQIATSWRGKRAGRLMALAIESETGGAVTKESLRSDIWPPIKQSKRKRAA